MKYILLLLTMASCAVQEPTSYELKVLHNDNTLVRYTSLKSIKEADSINATLFNVNKSKILKNHGKHN